VTDALSTYWYSRFLFERALALAYLVAFVVALNQFVPLLGEHGLEPVPRFVSVVPFRASPSLFYAFPHDTAFRLIAWAGITLSVLAFTSVPARAGSAPAAVVWIALWVLYLSFVNVGQTFYGFGWETLLLEAGFLTIFSGGRATEPSQILMWLYRWLLFRLMFGAGLIKLRGDSCWRDLTCLDYYFETQPLPNPLSWHFHWLPRSVLHSGVVVNHIVEIGVPFGYFLPQPFAGTAGILTILFQLILIMSGNLSWLNWLTIVLAIPTLPDRWLAWLPVRPPLLHEPTVLRFAVYGLAVVVVLLSIAPITNMLSANQVMNTSFEPLHIVNTYGAFGSITRERNEVVIEGTLDERPSEASEWREYEFKGKPGALTRRPPQVAPYHMRLDWLMWFAALSSPGEQPWLRPFIASLLAGDRNVLSLMRKNPFPDRPPRVVRAVYYRYRFTTPEERRRTGRWWERERLGIYFGPATLNQSG
jgi:Lipase maturation factor